MATRRGAAGSIAIQYEDFMPNSEWEEEEGANKLLLHLPDFNKEQLKITYVHSSQVINVLGERPMTDNKWSRFSQSFSVPQNFNVQKIQAKFQNGVLTITMPKITITKPPTAPTNTVKEENEKKEATTIPEEARTEQKTQKTPQVLTPEEATKETMKQKDGRGNHQKSIGYKERSEGDEKLKSELVVTEKKSLFEQEEISKKRKESLVAESEESSKKRKEANAAIRSIGEKEKKDEFKGGSEEEGKEEFFGERMMNVASNAKQKVKGLAMELSEERQLLVNIGVAVLVIAALGAYISYSYGSSGKSKD